MPCVLLKRSPVTPEILACILYEKYFNSVPLYRQSEDLANLGLSIPRQDMSNWIVRFAINYLGVPYDYMKRTQCRRRYSQCDETILQVLHEEGRDARTKSYVWAHTTGKLDEGPPIVIFAYEPTRGTDLLRLYYAGFSGCLSSDAYVSYEILPRESEGYIILCGCLMHARRRFAETLEIINLGRLTREQIEALPEHRALVLLGRIYKAEGELKSCTPEERLARRSREVRSLVNGMVETARRNGANPFLYLKYLLEKVPAYLALPASSDRLEELMPWSDKYRRYEEDEMRKAMEAVPLQSREKPCYRPSRSKGAPTEQHLPSTG